jgi:CHAT domain-containing protein
MPMSQFFSKATARPLISMVLIIGWVAGCASASNRIDQNRHAMEIAECRANKAYDILEEKLAGTYRKYKKKNNLMGRLYGALDLADFYVYGFIDYSKAVKLYAESEKLNLELKRTVTPDDRYLFKGKEVFFFETQGEFTFQRKYDFAKIAAHIKDARRYIRNVLESTTIHSAIQTDHLKIEILNTGDLLNVVKIPSQPLPPGHFDTYLQELQSRVHEHILIRPQVSKEVKAFYENYNIARALFKSFDVHELQKPQYRVILFYVDQALDNKEGSEKLWPRAYLFYLKTVCEALVEDLRASVDAHQQLEDGIARLTEKNRQLLTEKKKLKERAHLKAAVGAVVVGVSIASGAAAAPGLSDATAQLAGFIFASSFGDHMIAERRYAIVGESDYGRRLNVLLNIDEQLLLFEAIGLAYHRTGNIEKSIFFNEQAVKIINQLRSTIKSEKHRITFARRKDLIFNRLIEDLMAQGQTESAFYYSENARSRAFVDLMASARDMDIRNQKLNAYISNIKKQQAYVYQLRKQINITDQQAEYVNLMSRGVQAKPLSGKEKNQGRKPQVPPSLLKEMSLDEISSLVTVQSTTLNEVKQQLPADTALVEIYFTPQKYLVWAITPNNQLAETLPIDYAELKAECERFRTLISESSDPTNQRLSEINSAARALYKKLFAEIDHFLDQNDISRIILVPHRTTHFIPFEALHDGNEYLIERYSFSSIPAATVAKFLKTKNSKITSALIIGNPHVTYDTAAWDLPGAEKEARAIGENFSDRHIIMGLDASETEFYKSASSYDILHFACHGLMDSRSPMNSKLYLARDQANDGILTTKELYGVDLNAALVTLSACETGLSAVANGDELIGLVRGFFFAGARSVIASLWKVDDEATMKLMIYFYKNLRNGQAVDLALQKAKVKLLKEDGGIYQNPFFWSAFNLYGI